MGRENLSTVLKYPGSKGQIAKWIIAHFPYHVGYCEAYFGSGRVFLKKSRSRVETINDLDGNVTNLFKMIRDYPEELARLIRFTPWSRLEYENSYQFNENDSDIEKARKFLVRSWMAIGFKSSDVTGWKNNVKDINGNISQWSYGLPNNILKITDRLQSDGKNIVQIETRPAIEVIQRHFQKTVLIYADPPYPLSTRSNRIYKYEMTDDDHIELIETLNNHPGPALVSSYACKLYDDNPRLKHWQRETKITTAEGGASAGRSIMD